MRYAPYNTPFEMAEISLPDIPARSISAGDYPSIQAAIDHCASLGGGTVVVPSGDFHCAALHLKSNICLHLSDGAVLHFSDEPSDYLPPVFTRWEGTECFNYSPLIYAHNANNIALTGTGKLLGNGMRWWPWKKLQQGAAERLGYAQADGIAPPARVFGTEADALRPSFVQFIGCENVLIEGVTLIDGPQWTLHPVYCKQLTIRNVHVKTNGPNTDGLNPDSCQNVLIENCDFCTGDDCIAINSGLNEDGWHVGRASENIVIRNCRMTGGHGGVVVGSAISGGVRNVYAHDCDISNVAQGIRLKSMRGRGGVVEHLLFENIQLNDIDIDAIHINMFYEASTIVPRTQTPSVFRDITIQNIHGATSKTAIAIKGLPEMPLEDIHLSNIHLENATRSLSCTDVKGLTLEDVSV